MIKRPLVWLAVSLASGIFFSRLVRVPFGLIYALSMGSLTAAFLIRKKKAAADISLCALIFLLGLVTAQNSFYLARNHIYRYRYRGAHAYLVRGRVASAAQIKNNRTVFVFRAEEIQLLKRKYRCSGKILVNLGGLRRIFYGQKLYLTGNIYRPFSGVGSRRSSYRDYLSAQGIFFLMNAALCVPAESAGKNLSVKSFALYLKERTEAIIFRYVPRLAAAIMDAMVLGEKKDIPPAVYRAMVKSGTVHILVVSGFNVGIVSFLVVLLLKILRIRGKARLCLAALSLVIYCLACGASTPVVRATVMGIFFLAAFFCKREPDIYNSLAVAAILIMLVSPRQLFDVGFQLSFASVISIVYIYPKIKTFLRLERLKSKPLAFLADGCLVSFSAWLGTCGIIAANFRIFSPVTVLANIFIVPLATLITLCSFSLVLVGLALPPLAPFFGRSAELAVGGLLLVNGLLIKLPGAYFYLP